MKVLIIIATLFVIGSVCGYLLEVLFRRFFSQKKWMNPGFLVGPYIPLYGFGTIVLYGLSNIDLSSWAISEYAIVIIKILIIGVVITLLELVAGLIFIKGMHLKLWDYSDRWGNFKGLICPLFSILWLGVACIYFFLINPELVKAIDWISENIIYSFFVGIIIGAMVVDFCYSLHLGLLIKKFNASLVIKFEDFKVSIKEKYKEDHNENKFYGTIIMVLKNNNEKAKFYLDYYKEKIQNRIKKKKEQE